MLQLETIKGLIAVHHQLQPPHSVMVGRDPECDIVIAQPQISRQHAQLVWDPGDNVWTLIDMNSRSGTWLNGEKVPPARPCVICARACFMR